MKNIADSMMSPMSSEALNLTSVQTLPRSAI